MATSARHSANREDTMVETFTVSSNSFAASGHIPKKYGCEGDGINPDLFFEGFPEDTKTIAVIAEDPDAPSGTFDHWVIWNIAPNETIAEGSVPGVSGVNGKGQNGYTPPCPPDREHRYFFRAYALDRMLTIPETSGKKQLQQAMNGHILATAELMGRYKKTGQ